MTQTTITPPAYVTESEEAYDRPIDPAVARRLFGFVSPYRWQMVLSAFLMMAATGSSVVGPYLVKVAIDDGLTAGNPIALRNAVLLYLVLAIVRWIFIYTRVNIMARVGQAVIYDLRKELFERLQNLSLSFYSRYSVGRVITRVINDVENLRQFIIWAVLAIARDLFALVGIIIAMLALDVKLSLLTFITLPLMLLATRLYRRTARIAYRRVRAAVSWVNSVLAENINGIRVVQAFQQAGAQLRQLPRYHQRLSFADARPRGEGGGLLPADRGCAGRAGNGDGHLSGWDGGAGRVDHGRCAGGLCALHRALLRPHP